VNQLFYDRGWTDGSPSFSDGDKLGAMLRATNLNPSHVVATLDPMGGQATVQRSP